MSKRRFPIFFIFLAVNCFFVTISYAKGSLEYTVSMPHPQTHYFEVEIRLRNYGGDFADFKLPVWTPGSYLVREYAKNVEGFAAFNGADDSQIPFSKLNKSTWRVNHKGVENLVIRYSVYSFDGTVRMSYLDEDHAFIMANSLLMYTDDLKESSSILRLNIPDYWEKVSATLIEIERQSHA